MYSKTLQYDFTIDTFYGSFDGFEKEIIGINYEYPCPKIEAYLGDTLLISVENRLTVPTSLHWHGINQIGSCEMDGVPGITQRPILPDQSFTYSFNLTQSGTYWYHGHSAGQIIDGLRGPLIVYNHRDSPIFSDQIIFLSDWYHQSSSNIFKTNYEVPASQSIQAIPYTAIVGDKGQGIEFCENMRNAQCQYSIFNISLETNYCNDINIDETALYSSNYLPISKFRIINGGTYASFVFSIDNHSLWIISIDGVDIIPIQSKNVYLAPGQRADVIFCQMEDTPQLTSYWIRADIDQSIFPSVTSVSGARAILTYNNTLSYDSIPIPETFSTAQIIYKNNSQYKASSYAIYPTTPLKFTKEFKLIISLGLNPINHYIEGEINNMVMNVMNNYTGPSMLEQEGRTLKNNKNENNDPIEKNVTIIDITDNEELRIIILNHNSERHPWHMHGHHFYILAEGEPDDGDFDITLHQSLINDRNPPIRDTAVVSPNSFLLIQLINLHPGKPAFQPTVSKYINLFFFSYDTLYIMIMNSFIYLRFMDYALSY